MTLFDQSFTPGAIAVAVGTPAFCDFPSRTIPFSDEAVEMLGAPFSRYRPARVPVWVEESPTTLTGAWWEFHGCHPEVYVGLVHLARRAHRRGASRLGIGMLYEVLRWETMMGADVPGEDDFRLNNNMRAYYARFIMEECPDLAGIFVTRKVKAEKEER